MGQSKSKQIQNLSKATHCKLQTIYLIRFHIKLLVFICKVSKNEINVLRSNVKEKDQDNITEDIFKDVIRTQ